MIRTAPAAPSRWVRPPAAVWLRERSSGPMTWGSVLLHVASSAFQAPGGGENQLVQTGRHLEERGVVVRPFNPWSDSLREARLLHLFGMSREGLELARVARARNIPVVLSPICWYEPRSLRALSSSGLGVACDLTKWAARAFFPRGLGWRAALLEAADAIVPNSRAEAAQLVRIFRAEARKIFVVPNGVEARFAAANDTQFRERFGPEQFVLYVGRVEPRKNVLGLIRGARECGLPVVAVGDAVPGQASYARACHQEGRGVVRWLPRLEHDDPLLASAYAAARVFALPSWFETPGLAALEAALAGCAVVLTPFGCTYEYFGESVRYARPDRPAEIGRALAAAWDEGPAPGLSVRVARSFLWSEVSRATAEVYDRVAP